MFAKDLINDLIPALRLTDSALKAMRSMEEFKLDHFPVIEDHHYIGVISEEEILLRLSSLEKPISESSIHILPMPAVHGSQPVTDVVALMSKERIAMAPVLDEKDNYMGIITLMDVIKFYHDSGMLHGPGGMIVLEMRANDYSLTEIARLVEEERGKILNVSVVPTGTDNKVHVTIKFNLTDLSRIISSLERHSYTIIESHHTSEFGEDVKSNYDLLMKFLNL